MRKASNAVWKYCLSALAFAAIVNGGKSIAQTSNLPSSENPYTYPSDFENSLESLVPVYLYFTGGQEGTDGAPGQNGATIDFYIIRKRAIKNAPLQVANLGLLGAIAFLNLLKSNHHTVFAIPGQRTHQSPSISISSFRSLSKLELFDSIHKSPLATASI